MPLDKAQQYGYYDEMLHLILNIFSRALKTNEHLYFAVMTIRKYGISFYKKHCSVRGESVGE